MFVHRILLIPEDQAYFPVALQLKATIVNMVYFQSERYSKEEQKSAYAKLRESKKEKKAWEEDNEKRRQEEKPTRTLVSHCSASCHNSRG